jgi:hypothetical protein
VFCKQNTKKYAGKKARSSLISSYYITRLIG